MQEAENAGFAPFSIESAAVDDMLSYLFKETALLEEVMSQLLLWLDEGRIVPPPVRAFPLDQVAAAHREIESGLTVGKVVLDCRDPAAGS